MQDKQAIFRVLYAELEAMVATCFPKKCANCGRVYKDIEEFLAKTEKTANSASSMLDSFDPEEKFIVDLNRNCECGSTLMVVFPERRDVSEKGRQLRNKFGESLEMLVSAGIPEQTAREELKRLLYGGKSSVIAEFLKE